MREMKDSGIEWIGQIPKQWKVDKLRYHLRRIEPRNPGGATVLSLYREYGVIPKDSRDDNYNVTSEDTSKYKYVRVGDFVINKMKAWQGSVAVSDYEGIVSPAYYVYHFMDDAFNKRYFHYLVRGCYKDEFMRLSAGIRVGQWDLPSEALDNTLMIIPPKMVQEKVADFLDAKCSEIDALTADIEKQIETLEAYKKSVVTEAVTKGLNPDVEMKDSGIEELGEIPTSWDIKRLKYAIDFSFKGNGITKEQVYEDGDTPCVRYGEIYFRYNISFNKCISYTKKDAISSKQYISYGDILCAGTGELIEEIGKSIVYLGRDNCLAGGDIIVLRHSQEPRYLSYFLNSEYAQIQRSKGKSKLKVVHISATDIGNIITLLPPKDEQRIIADTLDEKCAEIDSIIGNKKTQIDILTDYKKSLIYEYVTGKKEVPNE